MDKPRLLLYGSSGLVGSRILSLLTGRFDIIAPTHAEVDLANFKQVRTNIQQVQPDKIIYAAGYTNVDNSEDEAEVAYLLNSKVIEAVSMQAHSQNIQIYYFSTDYVFSGDKNDRPYKEEDEAIPVHSVYCKSKKMGETMVLSDSLNCVVRIIMPFSAYFPKKLDLVRLTLQKLKLGERLQGVTDQKVNPVLVDDVVYALDKLIQANSSGIYHLGGKSYLSPFELMGKVARHFDLDQSLIQPTLFAEYARTRKSLRPQYSWLDISKFETEFGKNIIHDFDTALTIFKKQYQNA